MEERRRCILEVGEILLVVVESCNGMAVVETSPEEVVNGSSMVEEEILLEEVVNGNNMVVVVETLLVEVVSDSSMVEEEISWVEVVNGNNMVVEEISLEGVGIGSNMVVMWI